MRLPEGPVFWLSQACGLNLNPLSLACATDNSIGDLIFLKVWFYCFDQTKGSDSCHVETGQSHGDWVSEIIWSETKGKMFGNHGGTVETGSFQPKPEHSWLNNKSMSTSAYPSANYSPCIAYAKCFSSQSDVHESRMIIGSSSAEINHEFNTLIDG